MHVFVLNILSTELEKIFSRIIGRYKVSLKSTVTANERVRVAQMSFMNEKSKVAIKVRYITVLQFETAKRLLDWRNEERKVARCSSRILNILVYILSSLILCVQWSIKPRLLCALLESWKYIRKYKTRTTQRHYIYTITGLGNWCQRNFLWNLIYYPQYNDGRRQEQSWTNSAPLITDKRTIRFSALLSWGKMRNYIAGRRFARCPRRWNEKDGMGL